MFSNGYKKAVAKKSSACYETDFAADPVFYTQCCCQWFWAEQDKPACKKDGNWRYPPVY